MTRNLRLFELWIDAMKAADFNLRYRNFNPALPTMAHLTADYAGCQAAAIGWASRREIAA